MGRCTCVRPSGGTRTARPCRTCTWRTPSAPDTGVSTATIIHNLGRADQVDRDGLAQLVRSIARVLDPADQVVALAVDDVRVVDGRDPGGAWVADRLWSGWGSARRSPRWRRAARSTPGRSGRCSRWLPTGRWPRTRGWKRTRWVAEEAHIDGLAEVVTPAATGRWTSARRPGRVAAHGALHRGRPARPRRRPAALRPISTCLEVDQPDAPAESADAGFRTHGRSKDHRPDLPQMIIGLAVTRGGIPVRVWTRP